MRNSIEFYRDLGARSAKARNERDEARAAFHAAHFRAAKAFEAEEDRAVAESAYREAYSTTRIAWSVHRRN